MKIVEAPLPAELEQSIPDLLVEIGEYLDLEEGGFEVHGLAFDAYFIVDGDLGFMVFTYTSDGSPSFAFLEYSLAGDIEDSACVGCWPRTEGETLVWSIAEYFGRNPRE